MTYKEKHDLIKKSIEFIQDQMDELSFLLENSPPDDELDSLVYSFGALCKKLSLEERFLNELENQQKKRK